MIELPVKVLLKACWPGAAVFVLHSVLGRIFGHEPVVDPICHFSGGCAVAYCVLVIIGSGRNPFGKPSLNGEDLLAIGSAALAALAWEFGELAADILFGTHIQADARETLRDLAMGVCGAIVTTTCYRLVSFKQRNVTH